jgi:hypothetical protein
MRVYENNSDRVCQKVADDKKSSASIGPGIVSDVNGEFNVDGIQLSEHKVAEADIK